MSQISYKNVSQLVPGVPSTPMRSPSESFSAEAYNAERIEHWDGIAARYAHRAGWGKFYHRRIQDVYRFLIPPGQRVLEVGCGQGNLLASLEPELGVGVDFSSEMIRQAASRHPNLRFIHADAHNLSLHEEFDVIILSDLVNDLWDVQQVLRQLHGAATPRTRIILNFYSRLWQWPLAVARGLGLIKPTLAQNWLTNEDIANLLGLADFEVIRNWQEVLWPAWTPFVGRTVNRYLAKIWPFNLGALTNFMVARPRPSWRPGWAMSHSCPAGSQDAGQECPAHGIPAGEPAVSVIVPARNEAGNIRTIFERVPEMGRFTELVFVEGHSHDETYAAIEAEMAEHPERRCKLFRQSGIGKGDAVRLGFAEASGEVLMIFDADLTVPPEDLPRFYEAICTGKGEFINGVRLVYPMRQRAMRFLNLLGNKFFSVAFSWLLGQSIKDTLCGTKVLWRSAYEKIAANRTYFGDFDPFGDFDLLFGAAKQNLKLVDLPIRYRERTYGTTNIQRWKHGWLLLRMVAFAARRIKFF